MPSPWHIHRKVYILCFEKMDVAKSVLSRSEPTNHTPLSCLPVIERDKRRYRYAYKKYDSKLEAKMSRVIANVVAAFHKKK